MNEVWLGRGGNGRALRLGKLLGEGAAGKVHALPDIPGLAAKIYHGVAEARKHEAKIDAMLARPPELPPALHDGLRHPQIAWPEGKLFDRSGTFVGFVMPEIDFGRSTSLVNLLQKSSRRIEKISDYYGYRVLVARNLASVFAELHRAGHHMIDMKPANLRFYPQVSWMAVVDTDGFSIAGANGRIPADQLSDEYIAPECWKKEPSALGLQQDLFALAVIIFQLLNNGVHPFSGAPSDGRGQPTDLQARILAGLYPYGLTPAQGTEPSQASVHRMFRRGTRTLFDRAFSGSGARPTAEEWRDHLDVLIAQLAPCPVKPAEHAHFGSGCGFCGHDARRAAAAANPKPLPTVRPVERRAPLRPGPGVPLRPMARPPGRRPMPRRRRLIVPWRAAGALGAILLLVALADPIWRAFDLMPRGNAAASDAAAPAALAAIPEADVASFDKPRDYLVVPSGGALTVEMRDGPGVDYPLVAKLDLHQPVVGHGVTRARDGAEWVWVTRPDTGMAGYVLQRALLQRDMPPDALLTPEAVPAIASNCGPAVDADARAACTDPELAAGDRDVLDRYRELARGAEPQRVALLDEGQRQWRQQRQRCDDSVAPLACRKEVNARRLAELLGLIEAELERRTAFPAASETGVPIAVSELRRP